MPLCMARGDIVRADGALLLAVNSQAPVWLAGSGLALYDGV